MQEGRFFIDKLRKRVRLKRNVNIVLQDDWMNYFTHLENLRQGFYFIILQHYQKIHIRFLVCIAPCIAAIQDDLRQPVAVQPGHRFFEISDKCLLLSRL